MHVECPPPLHCIAGPDVTRAFLDSNGLELIVRSHEVKEGGYEVEHGGRLITVFSAPNYWVRGVCVWVRVAGPSTLMCTVLAYLPSACDTPNPNRLCPYPYSSFCPNASCPHPSYIRYHTNHQTCSNPGVIWAPLALVSV